MFAMVVLLSIIIVNACTINNDFTLGNDVTVCSGPCVYRNITNQSQFISCDNSTFCKITIFYPNDTLFFAYQDMIFNSNHFEYNITNQTNTSGTYHAKFDCYRNKGWFSTEFKFTISNATSGTPTTSGSSGGGTRSELLDYDTYMICTEVNNFIKDKTKNGVLDYNQTDLVYIKNELNNQMISIESPSIENYLKDFSQCSGFDSISYILLPDVVNATSIQIEENKPGFWDSYKYYLIFGSVLLTGIFIFEYSKRNKKKKKTEIRTVQIKNGK